MSELRTLLQDNSANIWSLADTLKSFTPERQEKYSRLKYTFMADAYKAAGVRPHALLGTGGRGSGQTTSTIDQALSKLAFYDGRESVVIVFHSLRYAKECMQDVLSLTDLPDHMRRKLRFVSVGQVPSGVLYGHDHVFWDHHAVMTATTNMMRKRVDKYIDNQISDALWNSRKSIVGVWK